MEWMKTIEGSPGQTVYGLLESAIQYLQDENTSTCAVLHNGTRIIVYRNSSINDLCDKFGMQRKLDQYENSYRR